MRLAVRSSLIVVLLALAGAAAAGPREDANAALFREDYTTALRLSRPLAEEGDAGAQFNLGFMNEFGLGVPRNYAEAARWYRLAADQGEGRAQNNLGVMYQNGQGVPQDYVFAHMWFNLSAAQGDSSRIYNRDTLARSMTPDQIAEALGSRGNGNRNSVMNGKRG